MGVYHGDDSHCVCVLFLHVIETKRVLLLCMPESHGSHNTDIMSDDSNEYTYMEDLMRRTL